MKIILKQYQEKAVKNLSEKVYSFLESDTVAKKTTVLKAPTGSGKTVMMACFIESLILKNKEQDNAQDFTFLWLSIGKGDLHNQSRRSLEKIFEGSPAVQSLDQVFGTEQAELKKDTVMVVNWEKIRTKDGKTLEWKNIVMKDGEQINFREMLDNTKRKIILIIDESHSHTRADRGIEIVGLIQPSVIVEVSATPIIEVTGREVSGGTGWVEEINPQDVIDEEMIKDQILANFNFVIKQGNDSDEDILHTAIAKREELAGLYRENDIDVNPLLLIQLPNSTNGEVVKNTVLEYLKNNRSVQVGSDKLAIWLDSTDAAYRNIENISDNTAPQEYLIFKQAIDTGWDCPRAQILLKFRDSDSEVFNIQVLGRILRMPEQKHYKIKALNKAYVYTNNSNASFEIENYSPKILGDQPAIRKEEYTSISLNSFYRERADYQDIKADFKEVLFGRFETDLGLSPQSFEKNIKKLKSIQPTSKGEIGWSFDTSNMTHEVMSDITREIVDIDRQSTFEQENSKVANLQVNDRQIEFVSKGLFKNMMAPFTNIARSVPSMNTAWFVFCRAYLGEQVVENGLKGSQAFLILNYKYIKPIFLKAVAEYSETKKKKAKEDTEHQLTGFEIIEKDYFNRDIDEEVEKYKKHILQPVWLNKKRSKPEKDFEDYLENLLNTKWWYKNGVNRDDYFAIKYEYKNETFSFYPDYLVMLESGILAILETKHTDDQDGDTKTKVKAEALHAYIQKENKSGKKLMGGIVVCRNERWCINSNKVFDIKGDDWVDLVL